MSPQKPTSGFPAPLPKYNHRAVCKACALALTRAQRQAFMDHLKAGQSIGEAREAIGCSLDAALGILNLNTVIITHRHINWTSK